MKKIVGIIGAAAVLVSSIFAADVAAATKINGSLFSYDAAKTFSMFKEGNDSHDYANPNITFSISDDKAGATVKLTTDGDDTAVKMTTQTIWFQPIDALKITLGNHDVALNKEQIDWTESVTGLGGNGYLISVNVSGFGLDFGLSQANGNFWLSKADGVDPAISAFFIKAAYGADFGNIGAFVEFNRGATALDPATGALSGGRRTYAWHDALFGLGDDPKPCWGPKDSAIKNVLFGAGYGNNFNGINMFVNVAGYMDEKFEWVRPEAYVSGSVDAFSYSAFVAPVIFVDSDVKDYLDYLDQKAIGCEVVAKVSYAMDGITPYAYFKDTDLLAKKFTATVKLGATGSVGLMGWNTWLQIDTGKGPAQDKCDISVPFELTVSF